MCEVEIEEIPGLPGKMPEGEKLLWQGAPRWQALARRCFKVRAVAVYFGIFAVWWAALAWSEGAGLAAAALAGLKLVPIAALAIALLAGLAWLTARTTIYSITSKRVAIRFGIALPMTINLPFSKIGSADLKMYADGTGDIVLSPMGRDRLAYLHLWPHVRPWRFAKAEPMLRSLPEPREAGRILAEAMSAAVSQRQAAERAQAKVSKINEQRRPSGEAALPAMRVAAAE
jgi:hypothetical protein